MIIQHFAEFLDSYLNIFEIVDRNSFTNKIINKNLPLSVNEGEKQYIKFDKSDLTELESEIYLAFIGNSFAINLISTIDDDIGSLKRTYSKIPSYQKFIKSIRKNISVNINDNPNSLWDKFYELNIIAYLARLYDLKRLDVKLKGQNKDFDLQILINNWYVNIEIYTFSIPGYNTVRKRGELYLDKYLHEKYNEQISFDIFGREKFSYSLNHIDLIIKEIERNSNEFLECKKLEKIICDETGMMIASFNIQFDENWKGSRMSIWNDVSHLHSTIDNYIKTVKNKSVAKLSTFPSVGHNFLLIHIATQHPIYKYYFDWEIEKETIKNFVSEGKLIHSDKNCIDYFEAKLSNIDIDRKYSGIILHRYTYDMYENHNFNVFLNPKSKSKSIELNVIVNQLENNIN